jgi:hypothetical protein
MGNTNQFVFGFYIPYATGLLWVRAVWWWNTANTSVKYRSFSITSLFSVDGFKILRHLAVN